MINMLNLGSRELSGHPKRLWRGRKTRSASANRAVLSEAGIGMGIIDHVSSNGIDAEAEMV